MVGDNEPITGKGEEGYRTLAAHTHSNVNDDCGVIALASCCCSSCSPNGWEYIIEGGKHALFSSPVVSYERMEGNVAVVPQKNQPTTEKVTSSSKVECRVCSIRSDRAGCDGGSESLLLRVQKHDLSHARSMIMIAEEKKTGDGEKEKKKNSWSPGNDDDHRVNRFCTSGTRGHQDHDPFSSTFRASFYTRNIVAPYLEKYIDVPEPVELSTNFLGGLYDNAMASRKIPRSRLKDWKLFELSEGEDIHTTAIGTLVQDYRPRLMISQKQDLEDTQDAKQWQDHSVLPLTIEFKPKAGYLALTPFILPQRRHLKYKQSRFVSLQQLQQQGLWTKGWSATTQNKAVSSTSASMISASTSEATTINSRARAAMTIDQKATNATSPFRMSMYDPVTFFQLVAPDAQKITTTLPSRRRSPPPQPQREDDDVGTTSATITSLSCLEETIACLLDNPQNNLRCFLGDVDILAGVEDDTNEAAERRLLLDSIFGTSTSSSADTLENSIQCNNNDKLKQQKSQNTLHNVLQDILVQVFTSHDGVDLLSRIHKWQSDLDVLDVDGALVVYDRLIELLKQQHQEDKEDVSIRAQHLIDCITESDLKKLIESGREFDHRSDYPSLLSSSPFHSDFCRETGSALIFDLLDEVESFQKLVTESHPDLPAEDVMDSAHQKCLDIVGNLNIEGCRFLLQNWLLSLMMCDISIFILLQSKAPPTAADLSSNRKKNWVKVSDGLSHVSFQLRVIDTDQKPSSKIPGKREKEQAFD